MSRAARIVVPGCPHHVSQRANWGADVFLDDEDRRAYAGLLSKYAQRHGLEIWAYCFMTNHVHLIAVPGHDGALARAVHDAHSVYGMRMSARTGERSHVWQGRFLSCPLDESLLWYLSAEADPRRLTQTGSAEALYVSGVNSRNSEAQSCAGGHRGTRRGLSGVECDCQL